MSAPHSRLPILRVLMAEDGAVNRRLLLHLLEDVACKVTIAINGEEAVTKFAKHPFDLVLMDVQMPVMDGLTATRVIRQQELETGTHAIIIAVTAGIDRETCLASGMDDHLEKPLGAAKFREMLGQWFCSPMLEHRRLAQ